MELAQPKVNKDPRADLKYSMADRVLVSVRRSSKRPAMFVKCLSLSAVSYFRCLFGARGGAEEEDDEESG